MTVNRTGALVAALAVIGVLAGGCGGSGSSAGPSPTDHSTMDMSTMAPSASGSTAGAEGSSSKSVITINDFAYSGPDSVPAGSTVTVTNDDSVAHTLTADQGAAFDVTIAPGASATFTAPAKAGSYPYHCTYHANMHGTLTVS